MGDAFKALADPTRRRILELLAQGDLTAGEIAAHFDMTKPSVSHHLNILRSAAPLFILPMSAAARTLCTV